MVLEELLSPISADAPCGEDLEYDAAFLEMERAAAGKPEQQMGDQVIEGEDPDWRDVKKRALELLSRTKDLRIATYLTLALLRTDQLAGFRDGMALLHGLVRQYWDSVHPLLDPDDDNDPTIRINSLMTLCDRATTLRVLRTTPLVQSRSVGRFSLREVQIASGEHPAVEGEPAIEPRTIEGAFLDCDLDQLQGTHQALAESLEHVAAIESLVTDYVGVSNAPSFEDLRRMLEACEQIVRQHLQRRGVGEEPEGEAEENEDGGTPDEAGSAKSNGTAKRLTGEIHSREDVIRALDKVCEYYERHEPSSPLPLLIRRAKRLASKSFLEIIRDLAPDALGQAQSIGGLAEEAEAESETTQQSGTTASSDW
jgi:type VI secretion system protein ImpA